MTSAPRIDPPTADCTDIPCLIAHVVNASSEPAIEFEVAIYDGIAWTSSGYTRIWPFWWLPLGALLHDDEDAQLVRTVECAHVIPDGWLDHLQIEAAHYAATHRAPARPAFLSNLLAKPRVAVPRRGL